MVDKLGIALKMKEEEDDSSGSRTDISGKPAQVMSVSTNHNLKKGKNKFNTVYVGTEPTACSRSDDGVNLGRE